MRLYEQIMLGGSPDEAIMLHRNPDRPRVLRLRVNWLFVGMLPGAASALLVLGVIFAVLDEWIAATSLFAGFCLCLVGMWAVDRRLRDERNDPGRSRDRARPAPQSSRSGTQPIRKIVRMPSCAWRTSV